MTLVQKLLRATATLGTLVTLAACGANGPSVLETPNVIWPDGVPTGEYENDPAVKALRAALLAEAVAWNALDYSDPDLVYRWGLPPYPLDIAEELAYRADSYISRGLNEPARWTALGPQAFTVYEVAHTTNVTSIVVCTPAPFSQHLDNFPMLLLEYHVELFDDGSSRVEMTRTWDQADADYFERCKTDSPVQGYFDPRPELFSGDGSDIKFPAAAKEYGFENVS